MGNWKYEDKYITDLNDQEIISIHLETISHYTVLKSMDVRSTLSFLFESVQHCRNFTRTKNLVPIMSTLSIFEQLGNCYNVDNTNLVFDNGIKRCLVLFGEKDPADDIIKILPALRNGLIHDVSFVSVSHSKYKKQKNYIFRYSGPEDKLEELYRKAPRNWDGKFSTLTKHERHNFTTLINVEKLNDLLFVCLKNAEEFNKKGLLQIKLEEGKEELFYKYLMSQPRPRAKEINKKV